MTIRLNGVYYGWYVVGACNFVAAMTWGIGIFNQGVFLGYFVREYHWSPATLSAGATLFHLWAGVTGIVIGRVIDRRGPKIILITGALGLAAGAVAFGMAREQWHVFPAFLLLSIGFACLHTVTLGKIIARWFLRQRTRAMALATFGAGIGGATLVPLNAFLLERWGGPAGGLVLAAIVLLIVVPLALLVFKDGPETLGLKVDGDSAESVTDASTRDHRDRTVAQAMRTTAFWALSFAFFAAMFAQSAFLLHQILFLQMTFGLIGAASVVTVTTVMGMVGRGLYAAFGNRWRSRDVAGGVFLLQAAAFMLFAIHPAPWSLIAGSAIFGFTMGVVVILQPLVTAKCFGQRTFGRVFGPIYLWIRIGSALGPVVIGVIYAAAGEYGLAWIILSAMLALAAIGIRWAVIADAGLEKTPIAPI